MEAGIQGDGQGMNIALIGFMGTGKTTVAGLLAERLSARAVELDAAIEEQAGMTIPQIFEREGEEGFRDRETAAVEAAVRSDGNILSCGGGAVLRRRNVEALKKNGVIVLLTAIPETVYSRVCGSDRPVLKGKMDVGSIGELMEGRRPAYEAAADITVATDGKKPEEIAEEIESRLKEGRYGSGCGAGGKDH